MPPSPAIVTDHFSALAPHYDAVLSDVWGVVHNGIVATPAACEALVRFRAQGKTVILITNAPRPGAVVTKFIDRVGVPREAYDGIVSSGDVTRAVMAARPGKRVFHLGPERDLPIFEGLGLSFVPMEQADYAVCTGLRDDETETAESYRAEFGEMRKRGLFMVCGNPDVVVERGDRLVYCAGSIADLYAGMGGKVLYAGKPYPPIYEMALEKAEAAVGHKVAPARVLAIGDSVRTDFTGARDFGVDFLFVTSGIHAEELGGREQPDGASLRAKFAASGGAPKAAMRHLVW